MFVKKPKNKWVVIKIKQHTYSIFFKEKYIGKLTKHGSLISIEYKRGTISVSYNTNNLKSALETLKTGVEQ